MVCIERKLIGARSMLALNFLTVTDAFTRDIIDIIDNPASLSIFIRGLQRIVKPHYMIAHKDGRRDLIMVRTVSWLMGKDEEHAAYKRSLVDATTEAASRAGYGFRLITDEQIYVQPRLANARMLRRHLPPFGSREGQVAALEALDGLGAESSVAELQKLLGKRFDAFILAIQLDWLGHLRLDRRTVFGRSSTFMKI